MSFAPPDRRPTRSSNGALIVHEGMPAKWHCTIALDDSRPELAASVTVMFDGLVRCNMRLNRLGHNEEDAIRSSRIKVLEWIGEFLHRQGTS